MKIVSLLPSATELVFALGLGDDLVGVTDECDFPDATATKPVVSRSLLPPGLREPADVDASVSDLAASGRPLFALDEDLIRQLQPDVILTQDLCKVCAVPSGQVREALDRLGCGNAEVVSTDPHSLDDVLSSFESAGAALGRGEEAQALTDGLRARIAAIGDTTSRLPAFRVLALEWPEPPWAAGHWVPEMIAVAGGVNLLSDKTKPSVRTTWKEIEDANPEIVAFMPCGYYLEEAEEAAEALFDNGHFAATPAAREGNVFAFDASATFSRPGPRLIEGLEALAWAIHPEAFPEPPAGTLTRVAGR